MSARVVETEPGLVAIEWPMREIADEYTRPVQHAALVTAARRQAELLGLRPGDGSAIVRRVAGEVTELDALRFTWRAEPAA